MFYNNAGTREIFIAVPERRSCMFKLTFLFRVAAGIAVAILLVATAATAPASQENRIIRTALQPDLSLHSVISPDLYSAGTNSAWTGLRTCVCSCGLRCTTDADCGPGGVCGKGITCCATVPTRDATLGIFQQREAFSSRQTPSLIPLSVNCKQK